MEEQNKNDFSLETVISSAVKIPGVKVNRTAFLEDTFKSFSTEISEVVSLGPVEAGIGREELEKIAKKLIITRTSESSILSFAAGIPGGFAMAATIPADILQFFGMTLRLAQELAYIYGAPDIWNGEEIDDEKVKNQLILYCGVMFGVSGAASGVRIMTTQLAKTASKRISQKALTKTFWFPIVRKIGKFFGTNVTKKLVGDAVAKALPVFGGLISGGINFASMLPMANKLQKTLDKSCFDYTESEMEADIIEIENITDDIEEEGSIKDNIEGTLKDVGGKITGAFGKLGSKIKTAKAEPQKEEDPFEKIEKLLKLKEIGAITEEEFESKKAELLANI